MDPIYGSTSRDGPEAELVRRFVSLSLPPCRDGEGRSIFIEPHFGQTVPDIVVVYWDSSVADRWEPARMALTRLDLRLAHYLYSTGPAQVEELRRVFPRQIESSLTRLDEANVAYLTGASWQLREMHQVFALKRVIAFEAKVSALQRALEQAYLNTWFASESYVLTSVLHPSQRILKQAEALVQSQTS